MSHNPTPSFNLDGIDISFQPGDTIINAATQAGVYIPHLCHHPDLSPHGSCRVCIVKVNGRVSASCITPATDGAIVESNCKEIIKLRKRLIQMLFVDGNHFCPSCEMSGQCQLQALAYEFEMLDTHYDHFFPKRQMDCSHPDIAIDRDRCINCELCVRASNEIDKKDVFSLGGRGQQAHLQANSSTGLLKNTNAAMKDKALHICPVGALLPKQGHYGKISGERLFDNKPISAQGNLRPEDVSGDNP